MKTTITTKKIATNSHELRKQISEHLNKKGLIKCRSKKMTRILRSSCDHHTDSKKGKDKPKPTIFNNNEGFCVCERCHSEIPVQIYSKSELKKATRETLGILNQAKFMAVAVGADEATQYVIRQASVFTNEVIKLYPKLASVAQKQDGAKKKKSGKKTVTGNENLGGWR